MQIDKARHLKTCEDFEMIKMEDSRGLKKTLQREEFYSQDILYGSKHRES